MARVAQRGAVVLLTVLLGVASTPPATATAEWTKPSRLGPSGEYVDVAVNDRGDMAAIWTSQYLAKARYRPAGQEWRKPAKVDGRASAPSVVLDDRGWATAVWNEGAAIKRPGRGWRFDPDNPFNHQDMFVNMPPAMATTPDGLLYLGWTENDNAGASGSPWTTGYFRSPKGRWENNGVAGSARTSVTFTPDRRLNIAEAGQEGLGFTRVRRNGQETAPVEIVREGFIQDVELVGNARGDLALVGVQYLGEGWPPEPGRLVAFTKPDGRQWRPMFSHPVRRVLEPTVALDDRGNVAVSYVKQRGAVEQARGRVVSVRGRTDGGARVLSPRRHDVASPSVALDDAGRAVFVWVGGPTDETFTPHAVVRSPRGRWAERRRLARPEGTPASQPQVVARGRREFTAVYVAERPMYVDLGR